MANEDQFEGKTKDIGGKVKDEVGDATGNDKMKHDGQADQVEGKVQKAVWSRCLTPLADTAEGVSDCGLIQSNTA